MMAKVKLVAYTPNPDMVVGQAATLCYSQKFLDNTEENRERFERVVRSCVRNGHTSVLEHAVFTFEIEGVSRALTHQLVRHRIASYSQQSQRYVESNLMFVLPDTIANLPEADTEYSKALSTVSECYKNLVDMGIPKEDARFVLPNATTTKIVVTMNARELLNFFKLRCGERAQWEIRKMANEMLRLCREVAPVIFEEDKKVETPSNDKTD